MDSLEKYFSPICNKFAEYKGFVFTKSFENFIDEIYNMEVMEKDVWVISFPKTGTTWTQEMVWMIINNLNYEEAGKETLNERSPYLESSACYDFDMMKRDNPEVYANLPRYKTDSIGFIMDKVNSEPCTVIKTHLPWELLPKQIQEGTKKPKIIYITRNPKDVCISCYYHFQKHAGYSGSFEMFCEFFLEGKTPASPFWSHVLRFYERKGSHILFITYEDLVKDLQCMIRKVAEFLGKSLTESEVSKLSEHLSFENMKKNPAVNKKSNSLWLKNYTFPDIDHIRNGRSGSFKETMSPEMIKKFDKWMDENIQGTGLTF